MSNYNYFYKETQRNLSIQDPEIEFKNFPKRISMMWKELDETQKAKYNQMQREEATRKQQKI
jgi:hypothetical protein